MWGSTCQYSPNPGLTKPGFSKIVFFGTVRQQNSAQGAFSWHHPAAEIDRGSSLQGPRPHFRRSQNSDSALGPRLDPGSCLFGYTPRSMLHPNPSLCATAACLHLPLPLQSFPHPPTPTLSNLQWFFLSVLKAIGYIAHPSQTCLHYERF